MVGNPDRSARDAAGCGGAVAGGGAQDVVVGDVPVGSGSGDSVEVHPELVGQVPDGRGGARMRRRSARGRERRFVVVDSVG